MFNSSIRTVNKEWDHVYTNSQALSFRINAIANAIADICTGFGINESVSVVLRKGEGNLHKVNGAWPGLEIVGSSFQEELNVRQRSSKRTNTCMNKTVWCIWKLPR